MRQQINEFKKMENERVYSQGFCSNILVDIIIENIIKKGFHTVFFMSNIYTFTFGFLLDEILDSNYK